MLDNGINIVLIIIIMYKHIWLFKKEVQNTKKAQNKIFQS